MEMAHDGLSFASFGEENSRSRLPGSEDLESRARKRPAPANVRAVKPTRKQILNKKRYRNLAVVGTAFRGGPLLRSLCRRYGADWKLMAAESLRSINLFSKHDPHLRKKQIQKARRRHDANSDARYLNVPLILIRLQRE
jgi:hypothetical protein